MMDWSLHRRNWPQHVCTQLDWPLTNANSSVEPVAASTTLILLIQWLRFRRFLHTCSTVTSLVAIFTAHAQKSATAGQKSDSAIRSGVLISRMKRNVRYCMTFIGFSSAAPHDLVTLTVWPWLLIGCTNKVFSLFYHFSNIRSWLNLFTISIVQCACAV